MTDDEDKKWMSQATRQELRATLADPERSQEQKLRVKLFLAKRIANGPHAVRQACERYHLTSEQSEELFAKYQSHAGERVAWAEKEVQRLEIALAELPGE